MNSLSSAIDRDLLISSYSFVNYIKENSKRFHDVLDIATRICEVKSAFITLLGTSKQDILSQKGIHLDRMDIKDSICQYTIRGRDLLMISDTSKDYRVQKLGLHNSKHKMMFYAGYPLYNIDKHCIGALCVSNDQPKILNETQKSSLAILASNMISDLDNQRFIMNAILNLNGNFRMEYISNISGLQEELSKQQAKIVEQNTLIEQQHKLLSQSNENLKNFAHIAAHDIKSPARAINSFAQILNHKLETSSKTKPLIYYSQIIQKASANLINLVSSILMYAESDSKQLEMSVIELTDVMDTVKFNLGEVINSKNAKIIDFTDSTYVLGHKEQLIQLFQNLISNALKYQNKSSEPIIKIECKKYNSKVAISISDNGIGIEEKNLYKIFEPFIRLHPSSTYTGTGLGLSTCLRVIENHGSQICIESELSKGTTITFALSNSSVEGSSETGCE